MDKTADELLEEGSASEFIIKYEEIIKQGYKINPQPKKTAKRGRPKRGKALCLIERLDNHKVEILRFINERNVPFLTILRSEIFEW
ncbi:MAG: hypothetical protein B6229_03735 [Spirochaetaceae bacterium 4572_7]|nr:MAG: hypothetical protein B6229_03735 [Spirochaetaceae bacterium 4572_7]